MPKQDFLWDVFISHATEDKAYVEPLVEALKAAGIRVWYDKLNMEWGDDLRPAIDRGLLSCQYAIVVFSLAFLRKKKWTEYELSSLLSREQSGEKLILPILHGITRKDLMQYSPAFADRLGKSSWKDSYADIVASLLEMLDRRGQRAASTAPQVIPARRSAKMTGAITQWNDANGRGLITGDPPQNGTFFVSRDRCTPRLQAALGGKAIPPDPPVPVTFDVDLQGNAVNVDLK